LATKLKLALALSLYGQECSLKAGNADCMIGKLFSRFFRPAPESGNGGRETIPLSSAPEWVESEAKAAFLEFNSYSEKKFSAAKEKISDAKSLLREFGQKDFSTNGEGENSRLRKIVGTSKRVFVDKMGAILGKFSPPNPADFRASRKYCLESHQKLQYELNSIAKAIVYTSILLKSELKEFGAVLEGLQKLFLEMHQTVQRNPGLENALKAKELVSELREADSGIAALISSIPTAKNSIAVLESKLSELESGLRAAQSSEDAAEHKTLSEEKSRLEGEMERLKAEFLQEFSNVEKPLKRLFQLSESRKYILPKESAKLLSLYSSDPFGAFSSDKNALGLKEILSELLKAMDSGLIEFKEGEKPKRYSAANELISGKSLEALYSECGLMEEKVASNSIKISENKFPETISKINSEISECRKAIAGESPGFARLRESLEAERKEFLAKKSEAEALCGKCFSKKVVFSPQSMD